MILNCSLLKISDNSNVTCAKCFNVYKKSKCYIGLFFYGSVKYVRCKGKFKKGDIIKGVIVGSKGVNNRQTGNFLSFDFNYAILVSEKDDILSNRVFGYISLELRRKKFLKLLSLSKNFL